MFCKENIFKFYSFYRAFTNVSLSKNNATKSKRPRGSATDWSVTHSPSESSVVQSTVSLTQVKTIQAALQTGPSMTAIQTVPTSIMTVDVLTSSTAASTSSEAYSVMSAPNNESDLTSLRSSPIPRMTTLSNQSTLGASADTLHAGRLPSSIGTSTPSIPAQVSPPVTSYNPPTPTLHYNYPSTHTGSSTFSPNTPTPPPTPPVSLRASTPAYSVPDSPASSHYADMSPPYSLFQGDDSYDTTCDKSTRYSANTRPPLHSERTSFAKVGNRESDVPSTSNLVETTACYNKELKK